MKFEPTLKSTDSPTRGGSGSVTAGAAIKIKDEQHPARSTSKTPSDSVKSLATEAKMKQELSMMSTATQAKPMTPANNGRGGGRKKKGDDAPPLSLDEMSPTKSEAEKSDAVKGSGMDKKGDTSPPSKLGGKAGKFFFVVTEIVYHSLISFFLCLTFFLVI